VKARTDDQAIAFNRAAHDEVGGAYDAGHPDIFNETEQGRLAQAVARVVGLAGQARRGGSVAEPRVQMAVLDVGSGTGNLVRHFLAHDVRVTATDLSTALLQEVSDRFEVTGRVTTAPLNGRDLQPLADGRFDIVATYSVLHHVPDYAALVGEMARVVRPGGVVYIDHERPDEFWTSAAYRDFLREAVVWPRRRWWFFLQPSRYWKRIRPFMEWRRWLNRRWMPEGDIHIWPDDHIEWAKVRAALEAAGCTIELQEDYLLFEPRYDRAVWERWRTRAADMRMLVARKRA
jgi:2-polyprenyl-3-methyl-5-hydroxy-6-metoxy-1,4-benzoquinol methylase